MRPTALIIEDEPDMNDILAGLVVRRGFDPVRAYCGKDGLALAQARPPDLLLLDLMLPDIDGFEICKILRTHRATNLIPVVMLTALTAAEQQLRGFWVGANCYVVKPYTAEEVFQAIDEAIAWRARAVEGQVEGELSFDIAGDAKYLLEVNDLLSSLFLLAPLAEQAATELCQAMWEIGQAAIEWALVKQVDRIVGMRYRLHPDRVTVTIQDPEPRLGSRADRTAPDENVIAYLSIREIMALRDGSPGNLVARGLVDSLEYSDSGDSVVLTKRFAAPAGRGA